MGSSRLTVNLLYGDCGQSRTSSWLKTHNQSGWCAQIGALEMKIRTKKSKLAYASNGSTILSPGTHIHGDIFTEGSLILEGVVEGRVVCNRAYVKPDGAVKGVLNCNSLHIEQGGKVDGELQVLNHSAPPQLEEKEV
jgi:hypothetical protein